MRIQKAGFLAGFISLVFFGVLLSCATDPAALQVENSLPQNKLAFYNDSFDTIRDDLWDRAGYVFTPTQMANLKIADMTIEDGRLRIDTQTGGFSKGGLVSTFSLRGDFDVQIDLQIDFLAGELEMDQVSGPAVIEKTKSGKPIRVFTIGLLKKGKNKKGEIFSGYLEMGKYHSGDARAIENFNGSLRFARTGNKMSMFYRKQGQNRWTKMCTLPSTLNDASIGFTLQNFTMDRNSITAARSISAWIDDFTVNAAQEIIESEI